MNKFYNTPDLNVVVDGKQWFPSRTIKDIEGTTVYIIPKPSFVWNNIIFALRGAYKFIKVLAGSTVLIAAIQKLL